TSVGAGVLGGDLTRSPGPIILDVVVVGEAPAPIGRGGAQPGDELWVTGELGASGLAVGALSENRPMDPAAYRRFAAPVPRVREALWRSERSIPRAMLVLSDGLAGDASHLAAASDLRVGIETEALPIHPSVTDTLDRRDAIDLALAGGEDYELC